MTGGHWGHRERKPDVAYDSVADPATIVSQSAQTAGIASELAAFPRQGTLAARLPANPFLMAPMAGVSDAAYRIMARAGGAALAYTEMVSVAGLHYGGDKTWDLVYPQDIEPDIAVQLFGSKPEQFREASAAVASRLGDKLALIDINMACPVPKVTRKGEGSALLDAPDHAAAIVRACLDGLSEVRSDVPVTVKIRAGRRTGEPEVAPSFAHAMEVAGASAVTVHGRTASQLYRGEADWGCVKRVVEAVDIPVIGSGDVRGANEAVGMMEETGATAVMVARGTYGNPWCFADALHLLSGEAMPVHDRRQRLAAFACHVRLLDATHAHLARARSLAAWYFKGMPNAASIRDRAMHCKTVAEYLELADELMADAMDEVVQQ
ncbi:MAG: tRNA-dihydrouridine synthase [Coriobacteriales bacterium]|nr:tRNA-dihydrouridine synthase [Coriobacteriales bacterium]